MAIYKNFKTGNELNFEDSKSALDESALNTKGVTIETTEVENSQSNVTQHQELDIKLTKEDFKDTIANYLAWKIS